MYVLLSSSIGSFVVDGDGAKQANKLLIKGKKTECQF